MGKPCFIVIARDDEESDGTRGEYLLTTRRTFTTRAEADTWASQCSQSREPIVVECPKGMTYEDKALRMANALAVFILDPKLSAWLRANDPKALQQATDAVNDFNPAMLRKRVRSTLNIYTFATHRPGQLVTKPDESPLAYLQWGVNKQSLQHAEACAQASGLESLTAYYKTIADHIRDAMEANEHAEA